MASGGIRDYRLTMGFNYMVQLELPEESARRFEEVKERLLATLKQNPVTQVECNGVHRYRVPAIRLSPKTPTRRGIYLIAHDEFVEESDARYLFRATAEWWISAYLVDLSERYGELYRKAEEDYLAWVSLLGYTLPHDQKKRSDEEVRRMVQDTRLDEFLPRHWDIIQQLPREEIEGALKEGIRIMEEALAKEPASIELGLGLL